MAEEKQCPFCNWTAKREYVDLWGAWEDDHSVGLDTYLDGKIVDGDELYNRFTIGLDKDLKRIAMMAAIGDERGISRYYPKFCPECGRRIANETNSSRTET